MAVPSALQLALDLARNPVLAKAARRQSLPADILVLLRIAAGESDAIEAAAMANKCAAADVRNAAILYLQLILWSSDGDPYRTLGVHPDAAQSTLVAHFRWLMKWLHPDQQHSPQETAFTERVVAAWNVLKTPERRAAYDQTLKHGAQMAPRPKRRRSSRRIPWIFATETQPAARVPFRWSVVAVVATVVGLGAIVMLDWAHLFAVFPSQGADAIRHDVQPGPAGQPDAIGLN